MGHIGCVRRLLAAGADVAAADHLGRLPIDYARHSPSWPYLGGSDVLCQLAVAPKAAPPLLLRPPAGKPLLEAVDKKMPSPWEAMVMMVRR